MFLAEAAMDQLDRRQIRDGDAAGLWDAPGWMLRAGQSVPPGPSWFMTERVMECLVVAHATFSRPSLAPESMISRAVDLLSEAEHLLNQEELEVESGDLSPRQTTIDRIRHSLDRARTILRERPGTAYSLAADALTRLDELAYARHDAAR
jgi:hypothetical protein